MESDKITRWLTFGANFGVLIGIILLVVELDQNREMIRAQTRNDIAGQIIDRLVAQGSDVQLASLKRRAEAGEALSADEEAQHSLLFTARQRSWENIHYQYRMGMFDEKEFMAEREIWKFLINQDQSFARHWCPRRQAYSAEFVAELESLLDKDVCGAY